MKLSEKYRPQRLDDVIGQPKVISQLKRFGEFGGRAYWIQGASGTGKTTIARIIAQSLVGESLFDCHEEVGRNLTQTRLKQVTDSWIYCGGHALIVNEAHGLSRPVIEMLLDVLEELPERVAVIFTTTNDGADLFEEHIDAGPFASRCVCLKLTNQGLAKTFAEHVRTIAVNEGMDGQPIEDYVKLAQKCRNNMRAMFAAVEQAEL